MAAYANFKLTKSDGTVVTLHDDVQGMLRNDIRDILELKYNDDFKRETYLEVNPRAVARHLAKLHPAHIDDYEEFAFAKPGEYGDETLYIVGAKYPNTQKFVNLYNMGQVCFGVDVDEIVSLHLYVSY